MSTRGLFTFKDNHGEFHVYKHTDCYPEGEHGGIAAIRKALMLAWGLPRFEADEISAAFVAANKTHAGNVRLMPTGKWNNIAPSDIEYHYIVTLKDFELRVLVNEITGEDKDGKLTSQTIFNGTLDAATFIYNPAPAFQKNTA